MKNIFENYNFAEIDKLVAEERSKNETKMKIFLDIVNEEIDNLVGKFDELNVEPNERGITILINRSVIFDLRIEDNNLLVNFDKIKLKINNLDVIRDCVRQMIQQILIPEINILYKETTYDSSGHKVPFIKNFPKKLKKVEKQLNFDAITKGWLRSTFKKISEELMNGEIIEKVKIEKTDYGMNIIFNLNCDRYGVYKNKSIQINNRGGVKVDLYDTPVEGCGIESQLEEEIYNIITNGK